MFGTPSFESPLTYFGVLLVTLGAYLTLSGLGILKIEKYTTPEGVKSWGSGLFLILAGLAILFVLPSFMNGREQQEVSILSCHNDPNKGIVQANSPIVLVWGWTTDDDVKRDEFLLISNFILEVDGDSLDVNNAQKILRPAAVSWRIPIGIMTPGLHKVTLVRITSRDFTDSDGYYPAGVQQTDICTLTVENP